MRLNPSDAEEVVKLTDKISKMADKIKLEICEKQIDLAKLVNEDESHMYTHLNHLFGIADDLSSDAKKIRDKADLYTKEAPW